MPEDKGGTGPRIQRKRRTRTKSDTEGLTKDSYNTPRRRDIANAKRKLESPEDREENKNRKKSEEETEKKKAEEELLLKFSRSRRISRSPPRVTSTGRREKRDQVREFREEEKVQTEEFGQNTMWTDEKEEKEEA